MTPIHESERRVRVIENKDIIQFEKLSHALRLGELVEVPVVLTGGLLHRMYTLQTTSGRYAVKQLNPEIMRRPTAMQNYVNSERISILAAQYVPALPARKFNGTSIQKVDQLYYLVFDWIEGTTLKQDEIRASHCQIIGGILADLHAIDYSALGLVNGGSEDSKLTDWRYYLEKGKESNTEWADLLSETIENLYDWNTASIKSTKQLISDMVITHRDLDSKNVMWHQDKPTLIDWESAGYRHATQDLVETAIYWSEDRTGQIDKTKFFAFIAGYRKSQRTIQANWRIVLESGFQGKLDWLEYSLKRSLWIECAAEEEQQAGTIQAAETIIALRRYAEMIPTIEQWLTCEQNR